MATPKFLILSSAFKHNEPIPTIYTQDEGGKNISPPLSWINVPEGAIELALICDDPDAPMAHPYVHWVVYSIPLSGSLADAVQGKNESGSLGYVGPKPPIGHGWHRYIFTLYALKESLNLQAGLNKDELLQAMKGKIISTTQLIGKYKRD